MLITPEDLYRLTRLEVEREGDHDVVWACRLARKLAWLKPTETEFQEYLGLVNHTNCMAYALRHDETLLLQQFVDSRDATPKFTHDFSCSEKDAFLCVRPYVILESPKFPETIDTLQRYGHWKALVGGKPIASGWLAEILVGLDGYGVRRKPYTFPVVRDQVDNVFGVGVLDPTPSFDRGGQTITPGAPGVFLGTGAKLEVVLELPKEMEAKLTIGVVSARYTTRAQSNVGVPVTPGGLI